MLKINLYTKILGGVFLLLAVTFSPTVVAHLISPDNIIESKAVNILISIFQVTLAVFGTLFLFKTISSVNFIKNNWKNVLLLLIIYFFGEIFIMASGIFLPKTATPERINFFQNFLADNDTLGYTTRPNLENFEVPWPEDNISGVYSSDELGFRNRGVDYSQVSKFFIGDSFTHGSWVDRNKTYYGLIGEKLQEEVVTFGVGGYGMAQYQILAKDFIPENNIDKTIFISIFANDLEKPIPAEELPSLYENEMLASVKKIRFFERFKFRYSALGQIKKLILSGRKFVVLESGMRLYTNRGASISFLLEDHVKFEKALRGILEKLEKRDDIEKIVLVAMPSRELVYREEFERAFSDRNFLDNEAFGFDLIKNISKDFEKTTSIDLTPAFRDDKDRKLYFDIDAHWNESGHQLAAENILQKLDQ